MTDTDISLIDFGESALRRRRLFQFSILSALGFAVTTAIYASQARWDVVGVLAWATLAMALCIGLNVLNRPNLCALVLSYSATSALLGIMWVSDGLRDSALLGLPVILMAAGQQLSTRRFWVLVGYILAGVVGMGAATVQGWRTPGTPGTDMDRLTDTTTFLLVAGFFIWFLANDMQRALERLRLEIARYQESERKLTFLAQNDALTQLPNRLLGSHLIEVAIARSERQGQKLALVFVDLDNFKEINDSEGHDAGDLFLQLVANRLSEAVRRTDIICRHGGDEFLIGLPDVQDTAMVSQICAHILTAMQSPFALGVNQVLTSCSMGVALYPDDGQTLEDLVRNADLAMYQAKEMGRNGVRFFDDAINASVSEHRLLVSKLRHATAHQQLVLHYQPVIDLASGLPVAAEALVRWNSPDWGLVYPGDFIPAAEKSGLISDMGNWVLKEACQQMRRWCAQGLPLRRMAVNLSPVQFRRGDLVEVIQQTLRDTGLPAHQLELEVTESTLILDVEKFIDTLQRIKALGVHIAIDDFGTGYSNLSYLHRFSVDTLKVDQSFVRQLHQGERDVAMVRTIIQLAKSLELLVTAEGVEDMATHSALTHLDCDLAQGYWFAKPMSPQAFEAYWRGLAWPTPKATPVA